MHFVTKPRHSEITNRYTNAEWAETIKTAVRSVHVSRREAWTPIMGSPEMAKYIDHTLLKLDATKEQIDNLCMEARDNAFKSVCVRANWVERAVQNLRGSPVVVACVVGFPEGTHSVSDKVREARKAVDAGAKELDMVINYPALLKGDYSQVYLDVVSIRMVAPPPIILKVILETSQLEKEDIIAGCKISSVARADFVKTSTGFRGQGATEGNVRLMKAAVEGDGLRVKASGGVKTTSDAIKMIEAGAERIGTSSGIWIMKESKERIDSVSHDLAEGRVSPPQPQPLLTRLYTE